MGQDRFPTMNSFLWYSLIDDNDYFSQSAFSRSNYLFSSASENSTADQNDTGHNGVVVIDHMIDMRQRVLYLTVAFMIHTNQRRFLFCPISFSSGV
jgi:hypothetical protein